MNMHVPAQRQVLVTRKCEIWTDYRYFTSQMAGVALERSLHDGLNSARAGGRVAPPGEFVIAFQVPFGK